MNFRITSTALMFALALLLSCKNNTSTSIYATGLADSSTVHTSKLTFIAENLSVADSIYIADTALRDDDRIFAYGTFIRLPEFGSKSGEYKILNNKIAADFAAILNKAKADPRSDKNQYHTITYDYFVHDSILTVKINDQYAYHLSEGTTAYTLYHFDFKNNKLLNTNDIFTVFGLSRVPVLSAFAEQCSMPPDYTEPLFDTQWFETIKWKDINQLKLYLNNSQQIVIIYPLIENGIEAEQIIQ